MSYRAVLQRGSDFFMKKDDVHATLRRVTQRLADERIPYAVIGGMALPAHGFSRFTEDVDILTTREGLETIHQRLVGRGYVPAFQAARKEKNLRLFAYLPLVFMTIHLSAGWGVLVEWFRVGSSAPSSR